MGCYGQRSSLVAFRLCQQDDGEAGSGVVGSDWMRREVSRKGNVEKEKEERLERRTRKQLRARIELLPVLYAR